MTDKVKQMAPVIWEAIQKSQKVLLHCHPSPDGDSIGSSLAFHHLLINLGKQVTHIAGDSTTPASFSELPGFSQIIQKNLTQIDLNDYDTFIILDSGGLEQITKLVPVYFPEKLNTINIDHHRTNPEYGKINLVDFTYPAVGQISYDLFDTWKINFTPEIAIELYLAIYDDTGGFKYPLTTTDTLLSASKLAAINPNFPDIIFHYENSSEQAVLDYIGLALSTMKKYFSGKVAIAATSLNVLNQKNITPEQTEKTEMSNILKSVIGNEIGVNAVEKRPGYVNLSFRTRDPNKYDLSKIALALGGGGHKAASGATINLPFDQAIQYLLQKISETYPDLGQP